MRWIICPDFQICKRWSLVCSLPGDLTKNKPWMDWIKDFCDRMLKRSVKHLGKHP